MSRFGDIEAFVFEAVRWFATPRWRSVASLRFFVNTVWVSPVLCDFVAYMEHVLYNCMRQVLVHGEC